MVPSKAYLSLSRTVHRHGQSSHCHRAGASRWMAACVRTASLQTPPPRSLSFPPQLYEAFTFLKGLGAVILVHAENGDLIAQVSGVHPRPFHRGRPLLL